MTHPPYDHQQVVTGNANVDSLPFRSWLIGHFVPDELGLRNSHDVEVKWGRYEQGFGESEWTASRTATTLVVLITGSHEIALPDRVITLSQPGDYLIWGPGVPHRWQALEACQVVTVRWPSVPGDTTAVSDDEIEDLRAAMCGRPS